MLRVWGGGLYESDHFYDLCDQLGLLVWQDFTYACGLYPDEGEYAEAARAEAVAAVRRLRVHPSLALWCGNNECQWLLGASRRLWGEKLYDEVLPAVVAAEDPGRPYWPGSPWGGEEPGSQDVGDTHAWNVWHGAGDWIHYREDRSRFVSEFGFASSCSIPCWDLCLAEQDKEPFSEAVRWHDKTRKGYQTYLGYVAIHFPAPQTLEDLVYYTQLNQAEAMKFAVEHWRRLMGHCWGALIWQLEDCWPVQSWALIDYAEQPKAAYYWARRYFAPVLLSLARREDAAEAHLVNDLLTPVSGTIKLHLSTFAGELLAQRDIEVEVAPNQAAVVGELDLSPADGREREVYVYGEFVPSSPAPSEGLANFLLLAEPKELALADSGLEVQVEGTDDDHFTVTLSAKRFAPYVWLRLSGPQVASPLTLWSDNFLHLRPGEVRKLSLRRPSPAETAEAVRSRLTIRHLGTQA
jgi:beta-mannosidase